MSTLFALLVCTAILIAVIIAVPLTVLAYRNPFRPAWLRTSVADIAGAIGLTLGLSFAVAVEIASLAAMGINAFVALGLIVVVGVGLGIFIWRLLRCSERLREADAGRSPFNAERPRRAPAGSR